jgi:hypothetical protein
MQWSFLPIFELAKSTYFYCYTCIAQPARQGLQDKACFFIWKTRNNSCFEGKLISSPLGLICYMCAFLRYWAGLQNEKDKEMLMEGASRLQKGALVAHEVARTSSLPVQESWSVKMMTLSNSLLEEKKGSRMLFPCQMGGVVLPFENLCWWLVVAGDMFPVSTVIVCYLSS